MTCKCNEPFIYFVGAPNNWEQICLESYFPKNFEIWHYFFQDLFTERCKALISNKISKNNEEIKKYLIEMLENLTNSENPEVTLRCNIWKEDPKDINKSVKGCHGG